jgi:uncharacterized protein YecT (DUF1311 family)
MKIFFWFISIWLSLHSYSQTQIEMNEEEVHNYKVKDAELNKVYKKLINLLQFSTEKELLVKAQQIWISYRDAHCAFAESSYEGGTMQPMVYFGCMTETTKQRIKDLNALIAERSPK